MPHTHCIDCGIPLCYEREKPSRCRPCYLAACLATTSHRTRHRHAANITAESDRCEQCGVSGPLLDRHHADGDDRNNDPANISVLCRRCHMLEDGRLLECAARLPRKPLRTCPQCGGAFAAHSQRGKRQTFCSRACYLAYRREHMVNQRQKGMTYATLAAMPDSLDDHIDQHPRVGA